MAQKTINIGSSQNKGDGDPLRSAFTKINDNFDEVYAKLVALEDGNITTEIKGSVFGDDSTLLVDGLNSKIVGPIDTANLTITGTIDSSDSSAITIAPAVVIKSDLTVENSIIGYISIDELQTLVAASVDFADFQARIAAL